MSFKIKNKTIKELTKPLIKSNEYGHQHNSYTTFKSDTHNTPHSKDRLITHTKYGIESGSYTDFKNDTTHSY